MSRIRGEPFSSYQQRCLARCDSTSESIRKIAYLLSLEIAQQVKQRRINVDATSWRRIGVKTTLFRRHLPAGPDLSYLPSEGYDIYLLHFVDKFLCNTTNDRYSSQLL